MNKRQSEYKPLLFTTTMRNPERLKDFLTVLAEYDGEILTNEIIDKVAKSLIQKGLYQPMKVSSAIKDKWKNEVELTETETEKVFSDNPQSHKEAGFEKGWPSRFDTWFKIAKELGLVWYWQNEEIKFSESGKMLLDKEKPENELMVFANAFAKYQRQNPFRRVLNKNVPLILLIQTIKLLNDDPAYKGAGISRAEIPLLLCWQDDNAEGLYKEIKKLRKKHSYTPSNEVVLDLCYKLLNETKRDDNSILGDYPDDFIRKMRLTGLFSLRGGGRFIDINTKESATVDYILKNYISYKEFKTEKEFFKYIGQVDHDLISTLSVFKAPAKTTKAELEKWVNHYAWESIKNELLNLAQKKSSSDDILKVIEQPLRLEFLTSLAILKKLPNVIVKPNFVSDDEGLPTSFASGGSPDIECLEDKDTVLVEVTLLTGTQQHIRESFSIHRHLEEYVKRGTKSYSVFISPKSFIDTERYFDFIKKDGLEVRILNIDKLVNGLEMKTTLNEVTI
ncbi:AlwI family type II restriction endonuclease [Candidatus Kuenenbacteria bacterium]|nr:AlwI family type II restriction endonuclease [Candidatus Kuenenbacteria bacterium]